ncbi:MAG: hypothetical protein K6T78_16255 [Alicyclobacillus sp.]|nr:hypothetical protein [Alicyclobacillus sp.]
MTGLERYHCCASCIHFRAERTGAGDPKIRTYCQRLGYDTRPDYQFRCWQPKPRVAERLRRLSDAGGHSGG